MNRTHKIIAAIAVLFAFSACQKNKLPSVDYVIKFEGYFIDGADTVYKQDERPLRILEDNKSKIQILVNTYFNNLSKSSNSLVTGILSSLGGSWGSYNNQDVIWGYGGFEISGHYEKKKGRIKVTGNFDGNISITPNSSAPPSVFSFPFSGTFEITPK